MKNLFVLRLATLLYLATKRALAATIRKTLSVGSDTNNNPLPCGSSASICRIDRLALDGPSYDAIMYLCNLIYDHTGVSGTMMTINITDTNLQENMDCILSNTCYIEYKRDWLATTEVCSCQLNIPDNANLTIISPSDVRRLVVDAAATDRTYLYSNNNIVNSGDRDPFIHDMKNRNLIYTTTLEVMIVMVNSAALANSYETVKQYTLGGTDSLKTQLFGCSQGGVILTEYAPMKVMYLETKNSISNYFYDEMFQELAPQIRTRLNLPATADISQTVDHTIFVIPDDIKSRGGETAWATLPGGFIGVRDRWIPSVQNSLHEIGHNFGLDHGYENNVEYEDKTTAMGISNYIVNICFNGYQMKYMDWFWERSAEIPTLSSNGQTVNVAFYGDYSLTAGDELCWVSIGDFDIFLSLNSARGINAQTQEYPNKLLVVQKKLKTPNDANPGTELLATLDLQTKTYTKRNYQNGNDLAIEICSYTAKGRTNPEYFTVAVGTRTGVCDSAEIAPTLNTEWPTTPPGPGTPTLAPSTTLPESQASSPPAASPPTSSPPSKEIHTVTFPPARLPTLRPTPPLTLPPGIFIYIDITYDNNPQQNNWRLVDLGRRQLVHYVRTPNEPGLQRIVLFIRHGRYIFQMTDSAGDGICCSDGEGKIEIYQLFDNRYKMYLAYGNGQFTTSYSAIMQTWNA